MAKHFWLYHTLGCHLCEVAEAQITPYAQHLQLQVERFDIADDDNMIDRYGLRIPVLHHSQSGRELDWPFDEQQFRQYLADCLQ